VSTLLERWRRGENLSDLDIVDIHGHIGRADFAIPDTAASSLVHVMDHIGVAASVISHIRCLSDATEHGNHVTLEAIKRFPGRLFGYCILWPASADIVRTETELCVNNGFSGIKLHSANGFSYDDPAYEPALKIADELHMPVLLHTWGEVDMFRQVRLISGKYPNLNIVMGHSGCLSKDEYCKTARELDNVYLDLCLSRTPLRYVKSMIEGAGEGKVLWGSDGLFINMAHQLGKVMGADLSDGVKRKILSSNARRLLADIRR